MDRHTPGPWVARQRTDTRDAITILKPHKVYPGLHTEIAQINTPDGSAEGKANARLIAAAPELLDLICGLLHCDGQERLMTERPEGQTRLRVLLGIGRELVDQVLKGESKGNANISPSAGPRTELVAESSDGPAQSSEGKVEQKRTPGDKRVGGSDGQLRNRLRDAGKDFDERMKDP